MKNLVFLLSSMVIVLFMGCGGGSSGTVVDNSPVGVIDISFDNRGYIVHDSAAGGSNIDVAKAVKIDANGKIVVAGYSSNGLDFDMAIWRYNSDGSLDISFNGIGYVTHDGGAGVDAAISMLIDDNGNIVVAGYSSNGVNNDMRIWRYTSAGNLDTSFNGIGYISHDNSAGGSGDDRANTIALDKDGNIVVAGYSSNGTDFDTALWRYTPTGSLDIAIVHNSAAGGLGSDIARGLVIDKNNKLVLTGYSFNGTDNDMAIWRFNNDGSLDTGFNATGYVTHHGAAGAGDDEGEDLVIDKNDNILVTGFSSNNFNTDMAIWRYQDNGTLDTNFNGIGYLNHHSFNAPPNTNLSIAYNTSNQNDVGKSILIDKKGNILVTGKNESPQDDDMAIWRYKDNGSLDSSFNAVGYLSHDSAAGGLGNDIGNCIVMDQNESLYIVGQSYNGSNNDMAIWKYK